MYRKILVALENGPADEALVPHVAELARRLGSELLLVHVADASHPEVEEQIAAVEAILAEMELGEIPRILALNKWEKLSGETREAMQNLYPAGIPVTALKRAGLVPLVAAILGLLPTEPTVGPMPQVPDSDEPVSVWDVEMGSDVVQ